MHAAWAWWDGEMLPDLAKRFPKRLRASVARKRAIVPAIEAWLADRAGLTNVQAMPYMTHALACLHSWPRYLDEGIFDPEEIALPTGLLAGFVGFEHFDPADETPFDHWLPMAAIVAFDADGPVEKRSYNRFAPQDARDRSDAILRRMVHPKPHELRGRPPIPDTEIEEYRRLRDAGLTNKEIGLRRGDRATVEPGKAPRYHAVERRLKRSRKKPAP